MQPDTNSTFTYVYPDGIDIEARAMQYAWCTYAPRCKAPAQPTSIWWLSPIRRGICLKPAKPSG